MNTFITLYLDKPKYTGKDDFKISKEIPLPYLPNSVVIIFTIKFYGIKYDFFFLQIILITSCSTLRRYRKHFIIFLFLQFSYIWILLFSHFFSSLNKLGSFRSFSRVIFSKSLSSLIFSSVLNLSTWLCFLLVSVVLRWERDVISWILQSLIW